MITDSVLDNNAWVESFVNSPLPTVGTAICFIMFKNTALLNSVRSSDLGCV